MQSMSDRIWWRVREIKSIHLPHGTLGFVFSFIFFIVFFPLNFTHHTCDETDTMRSCHIYPSDFLSLSLSLAHSLARSLPYSEYEYLMMTFVFCFARVFAACSTKEDKEEEKYCRHHHLRHQGTDSYCTLQTERRRWTRKMEKATNFSGSLLAAILLWWHHYQRTLIRNRCRWFHSCFVAARCRHFKFCVHTKAKKFFPLPFFFLFFFSFSI